MKKKNKQIAGAFFMVGLALMLGAFYSFSQDAFTFSSLSLIIMTMGSLLVLAAQIICLIAAARLPKNNVIWILLLFFTGLLGMTIFLLAVKEPEQN